MVEIGNVRLSKAHLEVLDGYQAEVDGLPAYEERVEKGKNLFRSHNRKHNATFAAVRQTLAEMCHGPKRCMYCEDSAADQIEHFRPMDLYPETIFAWMNYLYACGPCNREKGNRFKVIDPESRALVNATRHPGAPIVPPPRGDAALIDPRRENPLDFLMLDLRQTFEFTPKPDLHGLNCGRARYTIEVLRLNERDHLVVARRSHFESYRALLFDYVREPDAGRRQRIFRAIRGSGHPTVWWEMKRQRKWVVLASLFDKAPELLRC